jgi:hypothetical protein
LELRRGRGISVAGTPDAVINNARELIELARHHVYSVDEVINIIDGVT